MKRINYVIIIVFLLKLSMPVYGLPNNINQEGLNIFVIDLGGESNDDEIRKNGAYGDAILIAQNGKYLLMDTGTNDKNDTLINFLKKNGIKEFDIYLSHYHDDHYGKIETILNDNKFTINKLYLPNISGYKNMDNEENKDKEWYNSAIKSRINIYTKLVNSAKKNKVNVVELKTGDTINIGEAILRILWYNFDQPDNKIIKPDSNCRSSKQCTIGEFLNNSSLVSMINYHGKKFFTAGDIESTAERLILENGIDIQADIVKLSHHGSYLSNINSFIDKLNPQYAFISNNYKKGENHILWFPDREEKGFTTLANYLDKKISLASSLYNGNLHYNISPVGDISVEMSRNFSIVEISYINEKNETIANGKKFFVNNRSKSHIVPVDYIKKIDNYDLVAIDNKIDNTIVSKDTTVICHYKYQDDNVKDDLSYSKGDIDKDGKVGITDYILVRKHIINSSKLSDEQLVRADVNKDGIISVLDYIQIRKIILEK